MTVTIHSTRIRKVESAMCKAIKTKDNWVSLKGSATKVEYIQSENISEIRLWNHLIGIYRHDDDSLVINSCGHETNTTRNRLNAMLHTFFYGTKIFAKNYQWFIMDTRENKNVSSTKWFYDGMIVYNHGLSSMESHPLVA